MRFAAVLKNRHEMYEFRGNFSKTAANYMQLAVVLYVTAAKWNTSRQFSKLQ